MMKPLRKWFRKDQKRKAKERVEALLLEALDSGSATPMTENDWQEIRKATSERISKRQGSIEG
ncbi:MAG: type II toxin-antitoxin system ParD family antitoxin [Cyanobacteriota bacterium]|nr:type II toxin-antitoxin system ParD family antitoxin [Cyanobacteriota bacterium]